jgi:hypothetical protein
VSGTRREDPERGEHEELRTEETEATPREQLAVHGRAREHVPRSQEALTGRGPEQRDSLGRLSERIEDAMTSNDERDDHALPSPSTRLCDGGREETARPGKRDRVEPGAVRDGAVLGRAESRDDDVDIRQQSQSGEDGCSADELPGRNAGGRGQPSYRGSDRDMAERRHASVYRRRQRPTPTYVDSASDSYSKVGRRCRARSSIRNRSQWSKPVPRSPFAAEPGTECR